MNGSEVSVIGLCVVLAGCVTYIAKILARALTNDLKHIKEKLDGLPCDTHAEQLRQQEKRINGLKPE